MIAIAIVGVAAFVASLGLVVAMLRLRWHWAIDQPNERSLHSEPTPRSGGMAIMAGTVAGAFVAAQFFERLPVAALGLAFALAGVSLVDDRGGLPITARLTVHLLAAGVFAAWLTNESAPWWWMAAAMLAIASMTNFYNFMDGANGLAGGMAVAGFGFYGIAGFAVAPGFAALCFAIAAAAAGFLCFNFRGRIFMGDGGSVPLGFLAGALGLEGWIRGLWPAWFAPLVFAPFVADAVVTLARRIVRGEQFWRAHREHYYQRLVRMGLSHPRLAVLEYALMAVCGVAALEARAHDGDVRVAVVATSALILTACGLTIDRKWRRHLAAQAADK